MVNIYANKKVMTIYIQTQDIFKTSITPYLKNKIGVESSILTT